MRKRVVVVVFDQGWQVGEGHFAVQVDAVLLLEDRNGRMFEGFWLTLFSLFFFACRLIMTARRQCGLTGSYLFEQPVVSGFVYADVPHHQHLNTKCTIR